MYTTSCVNWMFNLILLKNKFWCVYIFSLWIVYFRENGYDSSRNVEFKINYSKINSLSICLIWFFKLFIKHVCHIYEIDSAKKKLSRQKAPIWVINYMFKYSNKEISTAFSAWSSNRFNETIKKAEKIMHKQKKLIKQLTATLLEYAKHTSPRYTCNMI